MTTEAGPDRLARCPAADGGRALERQGLAELAGQVADELPGDAARAGAAQLGPLEGAAVEIVGVEAEFFGVDVDGGEEGRLVHGREADPKAEAVGDAHLFF